MKEYVICFEFEGVLVEPKNINEYIASPDNEYKELDNLLPIPAGIVIYQLLSMQAVFHRSGVTNLADKMKEENKQELIDQIEMPAIDILTTRPERYRQQTLQWMENNGLMPPRNLFMCPDDFKPTVSVVNGAVFELFQHHYKDRQEELLVYLAPNEFTTNAFRNHGLPCYNAFSRANVLHEELSD